MGFQTDNLVHWYYSFDFVTDEDKIVETIKTYAGKKKSCVTFRHIFFWGSISHTDEKNW